ncbi:metallophosphoesterase [Nitrospirota bacterium]
MSMFLAIYFLVFGGMNVYVALRARAAFGFELRGTIFLVLWVIVMVGGPILVRVLERNGVMTGIRPATYMLNIWFGLVFLLFVSGLTVDVVRLVLYLAPRLGAKSFVITPQTAFIVMAAMGLMVFVYGLYEARGLKVERYSVTSPKIPAGMPFMKIVQITDVHLGHMNGEGRLRRVVEVIKAEEPDILVSTGDLVDGGIREHETLAMMLGEINAPLGKYAVLGNHEFYVGMKESIWFVERAGFVMLRDNGAIVNEALQISGADYHSSERGGNPSATSDQPYDRFRLLLKHVPHVSEKDEFDLQLSGHTHNGQIFPFRYITATVFPYLAGVYDLGGSRIYVSRGTGSWGPPVRVLSPPELTVFELKHGTEFSMERMVSR